MEYTSVYGAIKIDRDYANSAAFIRSIGEGDGFPFITTNMFGLGDYARPYYYENMLITFGTTYKYFGLDLIDWNIFILKIENILRNIDFESAKFHVDGSINDCVLYWANKQKHHVGDYRDDKYKLIETDDIIFGFGNRTLDIARPDKRYEKAYDEISIDGFSYPIKFSEDAYQKVRTFNERMKDFQIGSRVIFKDIVGEDFDDRIYEIFYDLKLKGIYEIINRYPAKVILYRHVDL